MTRRAKAAGSSCCGSRISTTAAAAPSSSTAFSRTCDGSASNGTSRSLVQSERTEAYADALDHAPRPGTGLRLLLHARRHRPVLTAPHGDAATSYPGTCRRLADDPERRATTPHCWRLDSAKALKLAGMPAWQEADGSRRRATEAQVGDAILARPRPLTQRDHSTLADLSFHQRPRHSSPFGASRWISSRLPVFPGCNGFVL